MAAGADPQLQRLVAEEHRRLVGLLALHTSDRSVAKELAQDAIVRLCQHWPRVGQMERPAAWLTRVAINLANSWLRRRAAERRALARAGPDAQVVEDMTATTVAVRAAVAALPRRQRTALVLRYYEPLVTELPSGERLDLGERVSGGGGYLDIGDIDIDVPDECLNEFGEVAVFNPGDAPMLDPD